MQMTPAHCVNCVCWRASDHQILSVLLTSYVSCSLVLSASVKPQPAPHLWRLRMQDCHRIESPTIGRLWTVDMAATSGAAKFLFLTVLTKAVAVATVVGSLDHLE